MNPGSFIQKYTQNLAFLHDCILGYSKQVICPDCRHKEVILIDRKFIFARLFECQACRLRFRHPLDNQERLETFYQTAYIQGDGITTHLPTRSEWECMVRDGSFGRTFNVDDHPKNLRKLHVKKSYLDQLNNDP